MTAASALLSNLKDFGLGFVEYLLGVLAGRVQRTGCNLIARGNKPSQHRTLTHQLGVAANIGGGRRVLRQRVQIDEPAGLFGPTPKGFVNGSDYHLVSNIEVDLDGDHAKARSRHLMMIRDEKGHPTPSLAGYYEDEFIREDGRWKILHRIDHPVMPTAEEWTREMAKLRK